MPRIDGVPGGALAYAGANGGKVTAWNAISTIPGQVVGPNPGRQSITFHNPGTQDIFVYPTILQDPVSGSNIAAAPSLTALGGCFRVFGGGDRVFTGECQGAWGAFAAANANNPLTIMDSNT